MAVNCTVRTTECTEILKLLCVALLDDDLALECDTHRYTGVLAFMLSGGAVCRVLSGKTKCACNGNGGQSVL